MSNPQDILIVAAKKGFAVEALNEIKTWFAANNHTCVTRPMRSVPQIIRVECKEESQTAFKKAFANKEFTHIQSINDNGLQSGYENGVSHLRV